MPPNNPVNVICLQRNYTTYIELYFLSWDNIYLLSMLPFITRFWVQKRSDAVCSSISLDTAQSRLFAHWPTRHSVAANECLFQPSNILFGKPFIAFTFTARAGPFNSVHSTHTHTHSLRYTLCPYTATISAVHWTKTNIAIALPQNMQQYKHNSEVVLVEMQIGPYPDRNGLFPPAKHERYRAWREGHCMRWDERREDEQWDDKI